ncbi:PqqD family protein [Jiulongibacter sp. NS-SX5]|uniref:PqqD family protein n=1 Tax=Jiulongibacter sp. NS-SX5 TaxID=3463854 RepID=UPI0040598B25
MEEKYTLSNLQVSTSMGGESVILNHEAGTYFNLNDVGSSVWKILESGPATLDELSVSIAEQYETTVDDCKGDIEQLLKELMDEKLVEKIS